jgi:hypothetical protein
MPNLALLFHAGDLTPRTPKHPSIRPQAAGRFVGTVVSGARAGAHEMNRTALTNIAPDIFRKRLLIEGYFQGDMAESVLRDYFRHITSELGLRTYGDPIIHKTSGQGKDLNEGYDAFVPLIDSGIYIAAWVKPRFLSTILYTCGEFDEDRAVATVRDFFKLAEHQAAIF